MPPPDSLAARLRQATADEDWNALARLDADVSRLLAARPRLSEAERDALLDAYRRALAACRTAEQALVARMAELPSRQEAQRAYSQFSDWSHP